MRLNMEKGSEIVNSNIGIKLNRGATPILDSKSQKISQKIQDDDSGIKHAIYTKLGCYELILPILLSAFLSGGEGKVIPVLFAL